MSNTVEINSRNYWDNRFSVDWRDHGGEEQSVFFASIAVSNLPNWFINKIKNDALTVADWGCATGDGTAHFAKTLGAQRITGIDFSEAAIQEANTKYPDLTYLCENWLSNDQIFNNEYDVLISSNTLEHFRNPYEILTHISKGIKKAIVLVLPYNEAQRESEHFFTFFEDNIPVKLDNKFRLIWSKVIDCRSLENSRWFGSQIVLIYCEESWFDESNLSISDMIINNAVDRELDFNNLKNKLKKHKEVRKKTEENNQLIETELRNRISSLETINIKLASNLNGLESKLNEINERIKSNGLKKMTENLNRLESKLDDINENIKSNELKNMIGNFKRFLRKIRNIRVKRFAYNLFRKLYWKLPSVLRIALNGPRHSFVRWVRIISSKKSSPAVLLGKNDISWSEFSEKILKGWESKYKGIFIQELIIDWNVPLFQRPQHIASAFGRLGYLTIYRTVNWSHDDVNGFRKIDENVWLSNASEVDNIPNAIRSLYSTANVHEGDELEKKKGNCKYIYEYIDHIDPEISGDEENIRRLIELKHFAFNGGVDYIVASAQKLYDEAVKEVGEKNVLFVPNGVDTKHYRNPIHQETTLSKDLTEFRKRFDNVVGYFGALAPWLWYEELADLITRRTDIGFVFIGPDYYGGADKLIRDDNVLYLGVVDYKILPAYAKEFDICFIPFKPGEIAQTTSPLKLFEYFALEKPVVTTSFMLECVNYPEVFHGDSAQSLSQAINDAIAVKDNPSFVKRLAELADDNDWTNRAKVMTRCFGEYHG